MPMWYILCVPVAFVLLYQFVKLIARYEINDLSEDIFANIHNSAVLGCKITVVIFKSKKSKNACK